MRGGRLTEAVHLTWRRGRFDESCRRRLVFGTLGPLLFAIFGCRAESPRSLVPGERSVEATVEATVEASRQWPEQLEALRRGGRIDLVVDDGWVDDRAFTQLPPGSAVERLWLDHGSLTDESISRLVGLTQLRSIRLRQSPLSDGAVARLAELSQLESLNLPQARVSAVGLSAFQNHPTLMQLRVAGCAIDDDACAVIAQMPALRYLHLIAPKITGAGLLQLAAAPRLQSLYVDACDLPAEVWEAFFLRAPSVHVHVDQAHLDLDPNRHRH